MLEARLLGQFDLRSAGSRINIPTLPARFLFAYLLLNQEKPQSREKLAALFWPDASDSNARTSLRQALWRIRKAFAAQGLPGPPILAADDFHIAINPDAHVWLDTAVLRQEGEKIESLVGAVSVYEGDLLPDCYDDWAVVEREYYQALFAQKMQSLLDLLGQEQRWPEVLQWAERWVTLGHTPEPAFRALMLAHVGLGDISQVEIAYRRCKEALWRDLGVEPSQQTNALRDRLVKGESSLTRGYELREPIGKSESSQVYRAYQPLLDREVAIKIISPRYANLPIFIRHFESEAQLIARLEHMHIRPLYDYWRDPGGAYLVMRWLNGGSLSEALTRGPMALEAAVRLLDQISSALASAHQRGIVHGQLKPDNILFDEEGNAYLTDFPIARQAAGDLRVATSTPGSQYLAAEQIEGEGPTELSDQFALAAMLFAALTGRHPVSAPEQFDEALEALSLGAGWGEDQKYEVARAFERALAVKATDRFPDVITMAGALRQSLVGDLRKTNGEDLQAGPALFVPNPYKGLRAFEEADAAEFFGRDALTERILNRLQEKSPAARFLALIGPSGCGKSSVLHAGLLPQLRRGALPGSAEWFVVEMSPGPSPLVDLGVSLLHSAAQQPAGIEQMLHKDASGLLAAARQIMPQADCELLIIIDHFEELFTLVEDEAEVDFFLNALSVAVSDAQSPLRVIIALRADYYDRPLMHPAFGELLRQRTEVVIPMNADEFWQAVVAPAERAGVNFEPGLPTTIISEVMQRPSALPLFQYALTELFENRADNWLTRKAYEATGGVTGALARRAEAIFAGLTSAQRAVAKQLFLRLANVEEGGGEALRQVALSELASMTAVPSLVEAGDLDPYAGWSLDGAGILTDNPEEYQTINIDPAAIYAVLDEFGRSRLLSFDHNPETREPTVSMAHEALIWEWDRLRGWLEVSRSDLRMQRVLAHAAREWLNAGGDPSYLLRGTRLDQLQAWARGTTFVLTESEQAFLDSSIAWRKQQQEEESRRKQREMAAESQRRRRDRILVAAGIATVLLVVAAVLLFTIARDQARANISGQLAAQCLSKRDTQFDLALLLCLEALRSAETFEARDALATLFAENPYFRRYLRGHQSSIVNLAFSEDSRRLASAGLDGAVMVWDLASGAKQELPAADFADPAIAGGGVRLALGSSSEIKAAIGMDGRVTLQPLAGGQSYQLPRFAENVSSVALTADGATLALGTIDGRIFFWDVLAGQPAGAELQGENGAPQVLAFSPDGASLAAAEASGSLMVWDVATGRSRTLAPAGGSILALEFSPDGRYLAFSDAAGAVTLADLAADQDSLDQLQKGQRAGALAFDPGGNLLAAGFSDGTITLWDVKAARPLVTDLIGHQGAVNDIVFSPDGKTLASAGADRTIMLRDAGSHPGLHTEAVSSVAFHPSAAEFASGSVDGTVQAWNLELESADRPHLHEQSGGVHDVAYSPDGRTIALAGRDGTITLIEAQSGEPMATLTGHGAPVTTLAFSPQGDRLASGSADNQVRLWDAARGAEIVPPLAGHDDWVYSVAFSPDGRLLASAGRDKAIMLWDTQSGAAVGEALRGHRDWVYTVAFSPDGRWLASGGADSQIFLWDLRQDPPAAQSLVGHDEYIFDLAFSRDGKRLFSAGHDGDIHTWDVATGQALGRPWPAHQGAVYSLDTSADGQWLVSGGEDAAVRLWPIDPASWICAGVGRDLTAAEWADALQGQPGILLNAPFPQACPPGDRGG